jgi:hypothetical protein
VALVVQPVALVAQRNSSVARPLVPSLVVRLHSRVAQLQQPLLLLTVVVLPLPAQLVVQQALVVMVAALL